MNGPSLSVIVSGIFLVALSPATARAEARYIHFSNDVQWTILHSAMILAAGMIGAALILRKPK